VTARADRRFEFAIVAVVATATILGLSRFDSSVYNNYVLLADAFAHGRVWIDWPGPYIDALGYAGRHYVIEGPVPAVLMVPFVAVVGTTFNQTAFDCVFAGLSVALAWHVARTLGATLATSVPLVLFFALGTDVVWCAIYGAVWFVAHNLAVFFTMLAIVEVLGKRRLWLVTLALALAAGSRFTLVLALAPLGAYALARTPPERRARALGAAGAVLAVAAILYVAYNEARWGTPYDIGYTAWYHQDQIGQPTGSPFRLAYLPYELTSIFLAFPQAVPMYPYLVPSYSAVALTFTSPALALAAFAPFVRGERLLVAAMATAAALVAIPSFVYYANGGAQYGIRHALDVVPFLFVLVVLAARIVPLAVTYALCAWSVAAGLWGIWYWRTFYDQYLPHVVRH
jgi:hypothetical protein